MGRRRDTTDPWQIKVTTASDHDHGPCIVLWVVDERSEKPPNKKHPHEGVTAWERTIRVGAVQHEVSKDGNRYKRSPNPTFTQELADLRSLAEDRAAALNIQ